MRSFFFVPLLAACLLTTPTDAFSPITGDFSKEEETDVRVLSYNVLQRFPRTSSGSPGPAADAAFDRVLSVINPDIISFQEIPSNVTANEIRVRLVVTLGGEWYVYTGPTDGFIKNAIASRWPILNPRPDTEPASEIRGAPQGLIDLPDATYDTDFYVIAVHFKALRGEPNISRRQFHADALASWFGTLRTDRGPITLAQDTPILAVGDFNFATGDGPAYNTMLTGAISVANQPIFGAPIAPDWDESNNGDPFPADPFTGRTQTFRSDTTTPNARLDRFIYTDSVVQTRNGFILNTLTMPPMIRTNLGLLFDDTVETSTSDHLPLAVDFVFRQSTRTSDWMLLVD